MEKRSKRDEFRAAARDPYMLAAMLKIPAVNPVKAAKEPESSNRSESLLIDGTNWSDVFSAWFDACQAAQAGYAVKCYECQANVHTAFNKIFDSSPGNLLVPALHTVCKMTHRIAIAADAEANSRDSAKLQNAVTLLQESFSRTYNDRKELHPDAPLDEDGSKKIGVLMIVNELFSIYFHLNTLRLCKNLVRPLEAKKLHLVGAIGQRVTYRYYVGRLNLFEDQYADAEANLEYALTHCHKNATHNKRCILKYLVPVKLYRGRLPSPQLLEKYQLNEFTALVEGIRKGDLRTFNNALVEFQHHFIRQGTYLLLEKCKTVCYRNLFKRVHLVLDKNQISLSHVATAFKWLGMPIDLDEVECILANLIFRGYIKGYLSHTKRVLVLSKRDPFPVAAVIAR